MLLKICVNCFCVKQPEDFYVSEKKCKECRRLMVKAAREKNADHYKAFDAARAMRPDRVAARAKYAATPDGKAAGIRARLRWQNFNKKQRAAHVAVGNAVRDGVLVRQPCEVCGATEVHGHHPDYDAPLSVVWLCPFHHKQIHDEFNV